MIRINLDIDDKLRLVPYYENLDTALVWYQDKKINKQLDNYEHLYTKESLKQMYDFLSTEGDCFYIEYEGKLIGDITLRKNYEICILIEKNSQNKHLGRKCVLKLIEIARDKNYPYVLANIYTFNDQSKRMFESIGFKQIDEENYRFDFNNLYKENNDKSDFIRRMTMPQADIEMLKNDKFEDDYN